MAVTRPSPGQDRPAPGPRERLVALAADLRGRARAHFLPWPRGVLRTAVALALAAAAAVAAYQIVMLAVVFAIRLVYPVDLEWMEGGMLVHAFRLGHGLPIYGPPNADIISYLYTPLYPALVGALGRLFGLGYVLGRLVSILSFAGALALAFLAVRRETGSRVLGLVAVALVCAAFPFVDQWYDLVRNDSLFLALTMAGVYLAAYHADDLRAVFAIAIFLALAFLTKQTASFFAAGVGVALIATVGLRRRTALHPWIYGAIAGLLVVLFVWRMDRLTNGWCWTYIAQIHQRHDFNHDRLKLAQTRIWHAMPLGDLGTVLGLVVAAVQVARRRIERGLLYWCFFALVGLAISSVGFGTEWSGANAFIPGIYFTAIAACVALGRAVDLVPHELGRRGAVGAAALACVWQLARMKYEPKHVVPDARRFAAAGRLLARLRAVDGSLLVPFHPFYPALVGRPPHFHHMGTKDVTRAGMPFPADIYQGLTRGRWDAIVVDDAADGGGPNPLYVNNDKYKLVEDLAAIDAAPFTITGYIVRPRYIYERRRPEPPPGNGAVLFDFEKPLLDGWTLSGTAFGRGTVDRPPPWEPYGLGGWWGERFLSSDVAGEPGTGSALSPLFTVGRDRLTFLLGGTRARGLHVDLVVNGRTVRSVAPSGSDILRPVSWDVTEYQGESARLLVVDDNVRGHVEIDEVEEGE